jgi:hypothetical protein
MSGIEGLDADPPELVNRDEGVCSRSSETDGRKAFKAAQIACKAAPSWSGEKNAGVVTASGQGAAFAPPENKPIKLPGPAENPDWVKPSSPSKLNVPSSPKLNGGGKGVGGAAGGILTLMELGRYSHFQVDGIEGRPDLKADWKVDTLTLSMHGDHSLTISDAKTGKELTQLKMEKSKTPAAYDIKDADGQVIGQLITGKDGNSTVRLSPAALHAIDKRRQQVTGQEEETKPAGGEPKKGSTFETRTQEERDLAASMRDRSAEEIQQAINELRAKRAGRVDETINQGPGKIDESARKFSGQERRIATLLANEGKNVTSLPEVEGQRNADATVDGVPTEFKTMEPDPSKQNADSATVRNQVNNSIRKGGQARNMILDARGSGLTAEEAARGIARAWGIARGKIDSIRIIGDGFDIKQDSPK